MSLHGVTVEDGVLIGMGSTLLEGVKVQSPQPPPSSLALASQLTDIVSHLTVPIPSSSASSFQLMSSITRRATGRTTGLC